MKTENDKDDRRTDLRTLDEHAGRFEVYDTLDAVEGQSHGRKKDARETAHTPSDGFEDGDTPEDARDESDEREDETPVLVPDGGQPPGDLVLELRDTETGASLSWTLETFTDLTSGGEIHYVFLDEDGDGRVMLSPGELLKLRDRMQEAVIHD